MEAPTAKNIVIPVDDAIIFALKKDFQSISDETKAIVAMQYFKEHRLGLGHAARMAGMPKFEFTQYLGKYDVDIFQYADEEWSREMELADKIAIAGESN